MGYQSKRMLLEMPELQRYGINCFGYYSNSECKGKLPMHNHGSCYEFCFLEKGMQPYYIYPAEESSADEARLYHLHGGEIFLTHPYEIHSTGDLWEQKGCLYWIQIDSECSELLMLNEKCADMIREYLNRLDYHILKAPLSVSHKFVEAFKLLMVSFDQKKLFHACQILSLFIIELSELNAKISSEELAYRMLPSKGIEILDFINDNLLNPDLSVDMVAEHFNYSRSYMMSSFKKNVGMTLHDYILRQKIGYACELLDMHSITDTAFLLNFSSSQHFCKVFKSLMAMSPSDYLRTENKGSHKT